MALTPILLIGPVRAGKGTIAHLIAAQLKLPRISLDELRWNYYRETGYNDDLAREIRLHGGFLALMFYRMLFDAYSVERVLTDFPNAVIDFGAGIGPFENQGQLKQIQSLFEPIPNIFLIVPSKDLEESLRILEERDPNPPAALHFDINAHFLQHPGYRLLAKHVIYTKDKTPEQSCEEILALLA
jgi:hypothetical protein